jgi:hypothetical protein
MEQESAATYGLDPARFKVLDDPKSIAHVPPPTDGVPNLLRGSLPQSVQLPPDFTAGSEYRHIPVYRLLPPQPSGVAGVNSAVQSTSKPISTEAAGVVVGKALPGTVGNNGTVSAATLNNVGDGAVRFARESGHSSMVPTTNPLGATDAGSSATVSVGAFTGQYSGRTVSYGSGSIVGLPYATLLYVYTSDATLSGGAVSFSASTSKPDTLGATSGTTSNIFVGSINTPASGGSATVGNGDGGSASNQTGAVGILSTATLSNGGWASVFNNRANFTIAGAGTTAQDWYNFTPTFNYNNSTSRSFQCSYTFNMTAGTGSLTLNYYPDGVTAVPMVVVTTNTANGVLNFSLPSTINIALLRFEASAVGNGVSSAGTTSVSNIRLVVNS